MQLESLPQTEQITLFQHIVDNSDNSVMLATKDGELYWCNNTFSSLLGYTLEEFTAQYGNNFFDHFPSEKAKRMAEMFLPEGESTMFQHQFTNKNDNTVWLQRNIIPVMQNEAVTGYVIVDSDMTIVKLAMEEISLQKKKVEEQRNIAIARSEEIMRQKQQIMASIRYASDIQKALLPPDEQIKMLFPESFIFFRPRDIVSGDFYWLKQYGHHAVFAVADCTGHGVPGAFMSVLGVALLNEIVTPANLPHTSAAELLNQLKAMVIEAMRQTGKEGENHDGMDIALCVFNMQTRDLQYAGAYNPLILVRNQELTKYKATRMPIGYYLKKKGDFTNHHIQLQPGDTLYMYSDGFPDQTGGEKGRKYMGKAFQRLLLKLSPYKPQQQYHLLQEEFDQWRGAFPQVDDIVVAGIRIV